MKMCFIISPYRTGSGRSRPNSCLMLLIVAAEGLRPAIWRAGSTPGVAKKIKNTRMEIAKSTTTSQSSRRMMKVAISTSTLRPQLRARVERVAKAVAEDVQGENGQHDHDSGRDRDPGSAVEQRLSVLDDRSPARLRSLDADREVRKRGFGQDRGRDDQRHEHDDGRG